MKSKTSSINYSECSYNHTLPGFIFKRTRRFNVYQPLPLPRRTSRNTQGLNLPALERLESKSRNNCAKSGAPRQYPAMTSNASYIPLLHNATPCSLQWPTFATGAKTTKRSGITTSIYKETFLVSCGSAAQVESSTDEVTSYEEKWILLLSQHFHTQQKTFCCHWHAHFWGDTRGSSEHSGQSIVNDSLALSWLLHKLRKPSEHVASCQHPCNHVKHVHELYKTIKSLHSTAPSARGHRNPELTGSNTSIIFNRKENSAHHERSLQGEHEKRTAFARPAEDLSANLMMMVPQFVFHSTAATNLAAMLHAQKLGTLRIACFNDLDCRTCKGPWVDTDATQQVSDGGIMSHPTCWISSSQATLLVQRDNS